MISVPLEAIEAILRLHPAVEQLAVLGVHDDLCLEVAHAFVVLKAGTTATEHELVEFCASGLEPNNVPAYVTFVDIQPERAPGSGRVSQSTRD